MAEKIILNNKEISKEEFEKKKKEIANQPGVKLIESTPNHFKLLIEG